jgi:hypothetical protein
MTPEAMAALVDDASRRIDNQTPISQEMGEALLMYCTGLENAVIALREQNAKYIKELTLRSMLRPAGRQHLQ